MKLLQHMRIAHMKRKAKTLMMPMIRYADSVDCGWDLACHIRPELSARYDEGMKLAKEAVALDNLNKQKEIPT